MIFTQEAPLTRKWFSGSSCNRSNWNKLGVNFEEGGNRSAQRKPSKSGWDRLKLNPRTIFVVEVEGVIHVHCATLTSHGVQYKAFYLDGNPSRYQPHKLRWTDGNRCFPFGDSRASYSSRNLARERLNLALICHQEMVANIVMASRFWLATYIIVHVTGSYLSLVYYPFRFP